MGQARGACPVAMKSPTELKIKLGRQWESASWRESRLLRAEEAWPVVLSIGKPSPQAIRNDLDTVKRHVETWRQVKLGEVRWEPVRYRAAAEPVDVPVQWIIRRPTEWTAAAADSTMRQQFDYLSELVANSSPCFHSLLVRRRSLWRDKPLAEVIQATRLAMALSPNCAAGRPLRTLSLEGIDTKFFERNSRLMTSLLDARYDGEVSRFGLEIFLGAFIEGSHWLLVIDLDGSLLPFRKMRVASSDLMEVHLPGNRVLIVENESCQHQLPNLPDTIAILGAGFDLEWTRCDQLNSKSVAYWGDIDTWGLQFLGKARKNLPDLKALLMSREVFESNRDSTVIEPVVAAIDCPDGLVESERQLYSQLLEEQKGRLEQEFLSTQVVEQALRRWAESEN